MTILSDPKWKSKRAYEDPKALHRICDGLDDKRKVERSACHADGSRGLRAVCRLSPAGLVSPPSNPAFDTVTTES